MVSEGEEEPTKKNKKTTVNNGTQAKETHIGPSIYKL